MRIARLDTLALAGAYTCSSLYRPSDIGGGGARAARRRAFARRHRHGSPGSPGRGEGQLSRASCSERPCLPASSSGVSKRRRLRSVGSGRRVLRLDEGPRRDTRRADRGESRACRSTRGSPCYIPAAHAFVMLLDPSRRIFLSRHRRYRRRQRAQRPRAAPETLRPAPWLAARTRGSRTSGCTAPATSRATTGSGPRLRAEQWAGATKHGPLPHRGRRATAC